MKQRSGFVSNSSSQSFIISGLSIETVARSMLKTVIDEWTDWDSEEGIAINKNYRQWTKNLESSFSLKEVKNGKIGVTHPSTNYNTYILKVGKHIYVDTANNHVWNDDIMINCIKRGNGFDGGTDDNIHVLIKKKNFFNVKNCLVHSFEKYLTGNKTNKICPNCKGDFGGYVTWKSKKLCDICFKGILGTKEIIEWPEDKEAQELRKIMEKLPKFPTPLYDIKL